MDSVLVPTPALAMQDTQEAAVPPFLVALRTAMAMDSALAPTHALAIQGGLALHAPNSHATPPVPNSTPSAWVPTLVPVR